MVILYISPGYYRFVIFSKLFINAERGSNMWIIDVLILDYTIRIHEWQLIMNFWNPPRQMEEKSRRYELRVLFFIRGPPSGPKNFDKLHPGSWISRLFTMLLDRKFFFQNFSPLMWLTNLVAKTCLISSFFTKKCVL